MQEPLMLPGPLEERKKERDRAQETIKKIIKRQQKGFSVLRMTEFTGQTLHLLVAPIPT